MVCARNAAVQGAPSGAGAARQKVDKLSSEVVDSNPYSRLMALQRMGVVKDYEQIRNKTVGRWASASLGSIGLKSNHVLCTAGH